MAIKCAKQTAFLLCYWRRCFITMIVASQVMRHGYATPSNTTRDVPPIIVSDRGPGPADPGPSADVGPLNQDNGGPRRSEHGTANFGWLSGKNPEDSSSTDDSDDHRGVANEPTNSKCCYRQKKYNIIGYDTTVRRLIRKDIGRCRRTYLSDPATKNPNTNARDIFKRARRHEPLTQCDQPCDDGNVCLPTRILLEQSLYANTWTSTNYEVIKDCQCVTRVHPCDRMSLYKVFHYNTPYETTVDVGECRGRCFGGSDNELECRATHNKTETVNGPNGHECVEVITGCACAQSCYRASHMVAFYVIKYNETTGEPYETVQEMDIGKCVGNCVDRKGICIPNTNCASVLQPNTHCSPKEYVPHTFQTRDVKNLTVHVINECRCN